MKLEVDDLRKIMMSFVYFCYMLLKLYFIIYFYISIMTRLSCIFSINRNIIMINY